jgi:8-oxo-dGTP diphosphatase
MSEDKEELASSTILDKLRLPLGELGKANPSYQIPLREFFTLGVSVDCVVFGYDGAGLKVLVIERGVEPYRHKWALPGDLVYPHEDLDPAAKRILMDLTGLGDIFMQQIKSFGDVYRHPMGRVITIAYMGLVRIEKYSAQPSFWADRVNWCSLDELHHLAFDHQQILDKALEKLKVRVRREPLGFELLPSKFTLNELQGLYEAVLDKTFDKGNFRKKIQSMNLLQALKESQKNVAHRPARLYRFDPERYEELKERGFSFEL